MITVFLVAQSTSPTLAPHVMNWNTFFFATYELILTIVFSLATVFVVKIILVKFLLGRKQQNNLYENLATAIFSGTIILCVLMLVNTSILPAVDNLNVMALTGNTIHISMVVKSFFSFLLFYSISLAFSLIIILLTLKAYTAATVGIDEMAELKNKNTAVSIIMSIVLLGITIAVEPTLQRFIFSLVKYEKQVTIIPDFHELESDDADGPPAGPLEDEESIKPLKKISPKQ